MVEKSKRHVRQKLSSVDEIDALLIKDLIGYAGIEGASQDSKEIVFVGRDKMEYLFLSRQGEDLYEMGLYAGTFNVNGNGELFIRRGDHNVPRIEKVTGEDYQHMRGWMKAERLWQ